MNLNSDKNQVTKRLDYHPSVYQIPEIHLTFELDEPTRVRGVLTVIRDKMADPELPLVLNGIHLHVLQIKMNEETLNSTQYRQTPETLTLFQVPQEAKIDFLVEISPIHNTALSGLYQSRNIYCTQCEAEGFRRIMFHLDRPDILSSYTTTIIADKKNYPVLLSNGNCIAKKEMPNGKQSVTWHDPFLKPSYLFALVAGHLEYVQDYFKTASGREVDLFVYVEVGRKEQAKYALTALKMAMQWDEENYGREYDLSAYYIVAIDDFNMGAMENKGLNIFNSKYILVSPELATDQDYLNVLRVVAHEYFHNWTGNRVTCRDWFQLSLKEGLTIFREQTFMQDRLSKAVMRREEVTYLREHQFKEDASPLAHPVRPNEYIEINNFYTVTIYEKGAEIWRMIANLLGPDLYRKAMDQYFKWFDGKAVTIDDLLKIFYDTALEKNVHLAESIEKFTHWFSQSGTPQITVTDEYDRQNKQYILHFEQYHEPTQDQAQKKPLPIPIHLGLMDVQGKKMHFDHGKEEERFLLTESKQSLIIHGIKEKPIPSLFRDFSAPVKWRFNYSDEDYLCLAIHDSNAFNRQEANYQYLTRYLLKKIHVQDQSHLHAAWADAMAKQFSFIQDPWLIIDNFSLPSVQYLGEQLPIILIDDIFNVREACMAELAHLPNLHEAMLMCYQKNNVIDLQDDFNSRGLRALKNMCLNFLMYQDKQSAEVLALEQFNQALGKNMTDILSALRVLVYHQSGLAGMALEVFLKQYRHYPLLIDKWFAIQAASPFSGTTQKISELILHELFDWKNPNKIYAVFGSFIQNVKQFHDLSGKGYALLGEAILKLNQANPQVASRLVDGLTLWQRYDDKRAKLQQNTLQLLLSQASLSKDVYEKVHKSVAIN